MLDVSLNAALDEANGSTLWPLLSDFQTDTQFIVSHLIAKGTMEASGRAAMCVWSDDAGIRCKLKTVSVRLEDVKEGGNFVADQEGVAK